MPLTGRSLRLKVRNRGFSCGGGSEIGWGRGGVDGKMLGVLRRRSFCPHFLFLVVGDDLLLVSTKMQ